MQNGHFFINLFSFINYLIRLLLQMIQQLLRQRPIWWHPYWTQVRTIFQEELLQFRQDVLSVRVFS